MSRRLSFWGRLAALWVLEAAAAEAQLRFGNEFQVNVYTHYRQYAPAVGADSDGDFVVTWTHSKTGAPREVFARRFSSSGAAVGNEFQVNVYTSSQSDSAVAMASDGDFVVAWRRGATEIFARRFSSAGAPLASAFRVSVNGIFSTPGTKGHPSMAAMPSGAFVVAWDSPRDDHYYGSSRGVFARRFTSAGTAVGGQFQVNRYTTGTQASPAVAVRGSGAFMIAWTSDGQDGSASGVFARRFLTTGASSLELQVNSYTAGSQGSPSVAASATGDFLIAWSSSGQDGSSSGVFARRFSSAGTALATEFQVNTYTDGSQFGSSVAADASGDFIVAWGSSPQGGGIFARRVSSAGTAQSTEFQLNTYTGGPSNFPRLAGSSEGDFVVAWHQSNDQDGSGSGVFAQRFALRKAIDIDGDGALTTLTDGVLLVRFLFGFDGTTLTSGAINATGCSRCDAAAIEAYLATLDLDIDGDGMMAPLTDGVLVMRFLFGFTGTTLTSGAVNTSACTRCDAAAIEAYLGALV